MSTTDKVWIPEITDERLSELAACIRPVHDFEDKGGRCYVAPMSEEPEMAYLRSIAYAWDPKPAEKAEELKPVRDITTYHTYGAPVYFKPSIAEVLAQIPADLLGEVVAFEIIGSPDTTDDLNREIDALNAGYHVATTRLFTLE